MEKLRAIFCCSSSAAVDDGPSPSATESREANSPPSATEPPLPAPPPRGSDHYLRTLRASNSEPQRVEESSGGDNTRPQVSTDELSPLPSRTSTGEGGAEDTAATMKPMPRRSSTLPGELMPTRKIRIEEPARTGADNRAGPSRPLARSNSLSAGQKMTSQPGVSQMGEKILNCPFYTNPEGENIDGLVRMKLRTETRKGGVADWILKLAARVLVDSNLTAKGCHMRFKTYSTLTRLDNGAWEATSAENEEKWPLENGKKYIFVTMRDGAIRIGTSAQGQNGHAMLAGYSPYVRYAGEVMFEESRPVRFSPASGTYMPPIEMSANAGFGPECECIDMEAWNDVK